MLRDVPDINYDRGSLFVLLLPNLDPCISARKTLVFVLICSIFARVVVLALKILNFVNLLQSGEVLRSLHLNYVLQGQACLNLAQIFQQSVIIHAFWL